MREKYSKQNYTENRKKAPPPSETNAETYYYKKQMDARTKMIICLQDGEEIEGIIEWYDIDAIKDKSRRCSENFTFETQYQIYV